jgi:hypothetical protein
MRWSEQRGCKLSVSITAQANFRKIWSIKTQLHIRWYHLSHNSLVSETDHLYIRNFLALQEIARSLSVKLTSCGLHSIFSVIYTVLPILKEHYYPVEYVPNSYPLAYVMIWSSGQEFLAIHPEASGSIPSASRFSERQRVWNGVRSASWGQLRS